MDPAAGTWSGVVVDLPAGAGTGAGKVPMVTAEAQGAVVVPAAVPAAPPAAGAARPALNRRNLRRTWSGGVVGAGAGKLPLAAAAAAPGAVVVPVAAAPPAGAAWPALNWRNLRRRWSQALVVLGCAAAAFAFFSINSSSPTANSRGFLGACASAPTDAEAAALRFESKKLLVLAAAQVLGATAALLVPARRLVANFAVCLGWQTSYRTGLVLLMLFEECHGRVRVDDVIAIYYYIFMVLVFVGYFVGRAIVDNSG